MNHNDNSANYSAITNFDNLPLALTVREAGQVLRVGRRVAYERVRCGERRTVRTGRSRRSPRDALVEYLQRAG